MPLSTSERASARGPWQVMLVDDHPVVREGLSALLSVQPDLQVCCQAGDTATALKYVNEHIPDIAVIDVSLKNENGLDLVRRLKETHSSIRTLVISMHEDAIYGERALAAGAMGYLNKQAAGRFIVAAIRQILDGKIYMSDELTKRLTMRKSSAVSRGGIESLTRRELDVFRQIGLGIPTVDIAKALYLSAKTIESHRQNIKRKLGLQNAAELSREAAHWVLENS